jgi:hypothetical protein
MVYRLPEDSTVPPKHVAVNTKLYVMYISCAYVSFVNE